MPVNASQTILFQVTVGMHYPVWKTEFKDRYLSIIYYGLIMVYFNNEK